MTLRRLVAAAAILLGCVLFVTVAVRGQSGPPPASRPPPAPIQPLPYSHELHVSLGAECRGCHVNPDAGKLMTYPPTATCMKCHDRIAADRPSLQALSAFAASGRPIPWVRVYKLEDYVYWQHGTHLAAMISCSYCHGPVEERY